MQTASDIVDSLTDDEVMAVAYDWRGTWARPSQLLPDGDWLVWLILAGRGFGKTRTGAEATLEVASNPELCGGLIHLIGRTAADVRDVMVEGESGILASAPPWNRPHYEPSKRRLTWDNGVVATCFSSAEPDLLRGPQCGWLWADELAAWPYIQETWDNAMFGLRLGPRPRAAVTTTPKPKRLIRELLADPTTHATRGSTFDNKQNLPQAWLNQILRKYQGTTLGRQELEAEVLDEAPGALWKRSRIDELRVTKAPALRRIVVGVDPAATSGEDSDEHGIVVVGLGFDGHLYVLADYSKRGKPAEWAQRAIEGYRDFNADRIVAEANNGGEMVEHTIKTVDKNVPVKLVHASRGKLTRAEPISAMAEQGKEHHVGTFPELEDQKCNYVPGEPSPDHMDADVWASTELLDGAGGGNPVINPDAGYQPGKHNV